MLDVDGLAADAMITQMPAIGSSAHRKKTLAEAAASQRVPPKQELPLRA
jgi:hypothetical protein